MREVTEGEFYAAIGPVDCHPRIVDRWGEHGAGYSQEFETRTRVAVGRILPPAEWGQSSRYFLVTQEAPDAN